MEFDYGHKGLILLRQWCQRQHLDKMLKYSRKFALHVWTHQALSVGVHNIERYLFNFRKINDLS